MELLDQRIADANYSTLSWLSSCSEIYCALGDLLDQIKLFEENVAVRAFMLSVRNT
jgi:hypothetical protein